MSLNIKSEETCRLAQELSKLTGETMTAAITVALRERIARVHRRRRASAERILEIGQEIGAHMRPDDASDPTAFLYDEYGLPK